MRWADWPRGGVLGPVATAGVWGGFRATLPEAALYSGSMTLDAAPRVCLGLRGFCSLCLEPHCTGARTALAEPAC